MSSERIEAILARSLNILVVLAIEFTNEMRSQHRQVFQPIAQRRQFDRVDIQAVIEILTQAALADGLAQRTIRCREDSHVDRQFPTSS